MTIKRIGNLTLCMAVVWSITMGSTARGAEDEPAAAQDPPPVQQPQSELASQSELAPQSDLIPQPETGETYANGLADDCPTCGDVDCGCLVGPTGRFWFRADYLLWWTRGSDVPPLVTTSTNPADGGILGRPTTSILFGGERIDQGSRSNAWLRWGFWLDCGRSTGVEFDLFSLGRGETPFSFSSSDGSPLLARPFYNVVTGEQAAELVSHPDYLEGTVDGRISEYFHSGGVNFRLNMCCQECCCQDVCNEELLCGGGECSRAAVYAGRLRGLLRRYWRPDRYRVDLIAGYRAYRLNDSLNVHEDLVTFGPVPGKEYIGIPTRFVVDDVFRSRNEFNGGELGMIAQFYRGRWSLEMLAKIGIGNNRQNVSISGHTAITDPAGNTEEYNAGVFALETNIGHYAQNDFVVIPQLGVEFGYQVNCNVRAYVGYNLLYWADVARAAEQIDTSINPTYIPGQEDPPSGERRPAFAFHDSDFWAQGLNAGLEWRF